VLDWFADGNTLDISDNMSRKEYKALLENVDGLSSLVEENSLLDKDNDKHVLMDFVIEVLHQHSMVGKEDLDNARSYSDMLGSMLGSIDDLDDFEDFEQ
jgi:magnesium chelatase subunit I